MRLLKILLIDMGLSLAIAGIGALLVGQSLAHLERWRVAILARSHGKAARPATRPTKIAADGAPYAGEVNVRMTAESVLSKERHERSVPPNYGASSLIRVQARSVRRFGTERRDEKGSARAHRFRKPLPEYADQE